MKEIDAKRIFTKALKFISLRPRSEREIKNWLLRKKVEANISKFVLKKLKSLDLINDLEFAKWWIEQRITFSPRGKRLIKLELLRKGVKRELIKEAFSFFDFDEKRLIKKLLVKKGFKKTGNDLKNKKRLFSFLLRKGFGQDVIKDVLKFDDIY